VRCTGVENPNPRISKPRGGFLCGIVGEAKKHNVCVLKGLPARCGLFAQFLGKHDDFEITPARKPVADAKRRRAGLAIDIKFRRHLNMLPGGL
jgi:hypothetical protein